MLKSMKQLGGPKKPMDKVRKAMAAAQSFPERKKATSEIMASIKKGNDEVANQKSYIKKLNQEAEDLRMEEENENAVGEREFGPDYKNLNLKSYRVKSRDMGGKESVETRFRSKEGDEDVERSAPGSDILKVRKRGEAAKYNFPNFNESIKDRIARVAADKKASGEAKFKEILQKYGNDPKALAEHRKMAKDAGQISQFDQYKKKLGLKEIGD